MCSRLEDQRLSYFQHNQSTLRGTRIGAAPTATAAGAPLPAGGEVESEHRHHQDSVYLPASFTNSVRNKREHFIDAMHIQKDLGIPQFFITATMNPNYDFLKRMLGEQTALDRPDIVSRVFHCFTKQLVRKLKDGILGPYVYHIYVVEFQKRGLPHLHMALRVNREVDPNNVDKFIDEFISVKLHHPNDPELEDMVGEIMVHNHTKSCNQNRRVQPTVDSPCKKKFPIKPCAKSNVNSKGYAVYKRAAEDAYVVSYNPDLLKWGGAHINVVFTQNVLFIAYIFKYMFKNANLADRVNVAFEGDEGTEEAKDDSKETENPRRQLNGIPEYHGSRFLSSPFATVRIFDFPLVVKSISVTRLPVHFQNHHRIIYMSNGAQFELINRSAASHLDVYMYRPVAYENMLYAQFINSFIISPPSDTMPFTLKPGEECFKVCAKNECDNETREYWIRIHQRSKKRHHLSRIHRVSQSSGDIWYLRHILLNKPLRSWSMVFNGVECTTYQEMANEMGLIRPDENQFILEMQESVDIGLASDELRRLLVTQSIEGGPTVVIWNRFRDILIKDHKARTGSNDFGIELALWDIQQLFKASNHSITDFGLEEPKMQLLHDNHLIDTAGDLVEQMAACDALANQLERKYNEEQKAFYDYVIGRVVNPEEHNNEIVIVMLDGQSGRGKTYLLKGTAARLISQGKNVVIVATTAIAALQYQDGTTAHSAFGINVINEIELRDGERIECAPKQMQVDALRAADVIIWDEAPMAKAADFGAVIKLLTQLFPRNHNLPMGGKHFILAGDFRQIPPVVPFGTEDSIVKSSIISLRYFRENFRIFSLIKAVRDAADPTHSALVDALGNGVIPDFATSAPPPGVRSVNFKVDANPNLVRLVGYRFTSQ